MIIRSLSRKTPSFRQLYNYINRDQTIPYSILWNLNTHNPYHQKKILEQFYENSALLAKGKRRNFLYHDIISVTLQQNISIDHQMQALRDIALKYIQGRGSNLLAYGRMHLEGKNLHIHLMLSANELEQEKRHYLSRSDFAKVQRQCEQYMQQRYPELNQPVIFCKERQQKPNKSRQREYEYSKRTGKKTKKQQVKEILADLLEQQRSQSLKQDLFDHGFKLYQRGKHLGVIYDGIKYRLETLGLREAFAESLSRPVNAQSSPRSGSEQQKATQSETSSYKGHKASNMHKIYEQMKQQEQAMQDLEDHVRKVFHDHFPDEGCSLLREGKTIHIEIAGQQYILLFDPQELKAWSLHDRDFLKQKLQPTIDTLDELLWQRESTQSEKQRANEWNSENQAYEEPELDL